MSARSSGGDPGRAPPGTVYLVGAGPGDPGLLTLRGKRCLGRADVVVYDYLANPRLLRFAAPGAECIFCGKHGGGTGIMKQAEINALLVEQARAGKTVVRLKGGDPLLFGRGGEEACALQEAGIRFEIVPGVTSASAVPAYAGIPLTHRDYGSSVTIVSGQGAADKEGADVPWEHLAHGGTLVLLMSVTQLAANLGRLREAGLSAATPAALVRWGTKPGQEVIVGTVGDLGARVALLRVRPPAVVVVGNIVGLRERLQWFETSPLFGRRIVVTRARRQASDFVDRLEARGAEVIELPAIEIVPPESFETLDAALHRLPEYGWVIFTSVNGVEAFLARVMAIGGDLRRLGGARLAAIGSETARALERAHLRADVVPGEFRAEALAAELGGAVQGERILLPRAEGARAILPETLRSLGARVDDVAVYRTRVPDVSVVEIRDRLASGTIDLLTFASSSTVRNFVGLVGAEQLRAGLAARGPDGTRILRVGCIGPITAATAAELGLPVDVQPSTYTIPAFVEAIEGAFRAVP
jgi:uroporphyrinogen III methyltransferase/synthase